MASTEAAQVSTSAPLKRARPKWKGPAKVREELDLTQLDFVDCEAVRMSPAQYRLFEGKLEVWDAELKTAWMVRESSPSRIHETPSQRLAGLAERISPASRAFPGWRADDIHAALNEPLLSERSLALVEDIGRLLGKWDGTGPDDDPMLRSLRAESRAEGRTESRARMAHEMLLVRGIEVSEGFLADPSALAELPESAIVAAAQACDSERDFLLRLGRRQR